MAVPAIPMQPMPIMCGVAVAEAGVVATDAALAAARGEFSASAALTAKTAPIPTDRRARETLSAFIRELRCVLFFCGRRISPPFTTAYPAATETPQTFFRILQVIKKSNTIAKTTFVPNLWAILMNPWLETALALLTVLLSVAAGFLFSRLPRPWWLLGYVLPLMVVLAFAVAIRRPDLAMQPWLSWIFVGRRKSFLMGSVVALMLATLIPRLPGRRDRLALLALALVAASYVGAWPSLAAAVNRRQLAGLTTQIGPDGVCRQNTDYTCGPAAAVTGLRRLGLKAEEGELALLAHTSSASGTPPDVLADVLNERFGPVGLHAELRRFRELAELRGLGPTLVIVRFSLLLDHWLCVLEVTDREVVVGDPLTGLIRLTHAEFNDRWRHIGVTLTRR